MIGVSAFMYDKPNDRYQYNLTLIRLKIKSDKITFTIAFLFSQKINTC